MERILTTINTEHEYEEILANSDLLTDYIPAGTSVAVKINLPKLATLERPRTDMRLLRAVVNTLCKRHCRITIIESARGKLEKYLNQSGFFDEIEPFHYIDVCDLDTQKVISVKSISGVHHHIPSILKTFDVRIAVHNVSKLANRIFSCNVKGFVGIVPCNHYKCRADDLWRTLVHTDLHFFVADIYNVIQRYYPFSIFINGGVWYVEGKQELGDMPYLLVGDSAPEIDSFLINKLQMHEPEYLTKVRK